MQYFWAGGQAVYKQPTNLYNLYNLSPKQSQVSISKNQYIHLILLMNYLVLDFYGSLFRTY